MAKKQGFRPRVEFSNTLLCIIKIQKAKNRGNFENRRCISISLVSKKLKIFLSARSLTRVSKNAILRHEFFYLQDRDYKRLLRILNPSQKDLGSWSVSRDHTRAAHANSRYAGIAAASRPYQAWARLAKTTFSDLEEKMQTRDAKIISKWLRSTEIPWRMPMSPDMAKLFKTVPKPPAWCVESRWKAGTETIAQTLAATFPLSENPPTWNPPDIATFTKALLDARGAAGCDGMETQYIPVEAVQQLFRPTERWYRAESPTGIRIWTSCEPP